MFHFFKKNSAIWSVSFVLLGFGLSACSPNNEEPVIFLPKVHNPRGVEAEELRQLYCSPAKISFRDGFLTDSNIQNIFRCANYDNGLNDLKPLINSSDFRPFLDNMNAVLSSNAAKDWNSTLHNWLEPQNGEKAKIDELLPLLSSIIKNPVFQEALPAVHNILNDGKEIWHDLLPSLADLIYTERFPYTFDDLRTLFSAEPENQNGKEISSSDTAKWVKLWAQFLAARNTAGKTTAAEILGILDDAQNLKLPNSTFAEYFDQLNVKGAITAIYQESGRHRGETINPKLNADPDKDELAGGNPLTPDERQKKAYRQLFEGGENAPIVQLASIVHEFNRPHPNFFPALGRWFSGNGDKISEGLSEYVAEALIRGAIPKVNLESLLVQAAERKFGSQRYRIKSGEFVAFLDAEFKDPEFSNWLASALKRANREQFGPKNAHLFELSHLKDEILALYQMRAVAGFGAVIVPDGTALPVNQAVKRFSNLHRGDKLLVTVGTKTANLESHMTDVWLTASKDSMGESIVIGFGLKLAQSLFTEFANGFADKKVTISKWYYQNAYADPSSSEAIAAYVFKDLNFLDVWERNQDKLKNEVAAEIFSDPNDIRAFRLLIDQVPNIWLYVRSGMMRSGNDLTRVLAERDNGYLIFNYVDIVDKITESGLLARAVPLISQYLNMEAAQGLNADPEPYVDSLEERRQIAKGTDALGRVMGALLEPANPGAYESTTAHKLLIPFTGLVKDEKREIMEHVLIKASDEILSTPDDKLNDFFAKLRSSPKDRATKVETVKAVSELLKNEKLPDIVGNVDRFFEDHAVKKALDFFAKKVDDGTLDRVLLFIRRVLGLRGGA